MTPLFYCRFPVRWWWYSLTGLIVAIWGDRQRSCYHLLCQGGVAEKMWLWIYYKDCRFQLWGAVGWKHIKGRPGYRSIGIQEKKTTHSSPTIWVIRWLVSNGGKSQLVNFGTYFIVSSSSTTRAAPHLFHYIWSRPMENSWRRRRR